jgi:hypothetical protein
MPMKPGTRHRIRKGEETDNIVVKELSHYDKSKKEHMWHAECKHCGSDLLVVSSQIKHRKSCGCTKRKRKPVIREAKVSSPAEAIVRGRWV